MVNPFLFFFKCLVLSILGYKKEKLVINDLFNKFSYRYNQNDQSSFLIPGRYLKAALVLLFKPNPAPSLDHSNGKFAFDGKSHILKIKQEYLEFIGIPMPYFIFRDNLYNRMPVLLRFYYALQLAITFILLTPVICFRKDKAKVSVILLELVECLLLTKFLKENKCRELLIFQAYEKDIPFIAYFLQNTIRPAISLVPSSNPISFYYKHVIGDTFIFTAPFQKIEYQKLKHNWHISQTQVWPPFGVNVVKRNAEPEKIQHDFTLGFMSSASAIREHLHHANNLQNADYLAEYALIAALKKWLYETHLNVKLIIYLHPLEKETTENLSFSKKYYEAIFSDGFEFAPLNVPSRECFQLSEIGIAGFSSSQMERLYGGYKTIFAPMGKLSNYFSDERLEAISVQNYKELKDQLEKAFKMSDEEFYELYNLKEYRWDTYPDNKHVNLNAQLQK